VSDAQGKKLQEVQGTMSLQREAEAAGKFRWDYNKPYEQQIVGDGTRVWLFDPDLNQVTVRPMSKALGSTPAALLAGSQQIENSFTLAEEPNKDGLEWVRATAKDQDSGFEKIYLGFKGQNLQAMQLYDNFGNLTRIQFSKLERNPKLTDAMFHFKPPANADIVGE
jgi:outer membrane lipoprotein carrier protein